MTAIAVDFSPVLDLTDEQFWQLCQANRDLRMERSPRGDLIVMAPTGSDTGHRNSQLNYQLTAWSNASGLGLAFDSSTGFKLPNGATRSPDAAWIRRDRWDALSAAERSRFAPCCPDFLAELKSPSDDLDALQAKMVEYRENGTRLGWLLDRETRTVWAYRPGAEPDRLTAPDRLSGDPVLPGFVLDLGPIW